MEELLKEPSSTTFPMAYAPIHCQTETNISANLKEVIVMDQASSLSLVVSVTKVSSSIIGLMALER